MFAIIPRTTAHAPLDASVRRAAHVRGRSARLRPDLSPRYDRSGRPGPLYQLWSWILRPRSRVELLQPLRAGLLLPDVRQRHLHPLSGRFLLRDARQRLVPAVSSGLDLVEQRQFPVHDVPAGFGPECQPYAVRRSADARAPLELGTGQDHLSLTLCADNWV